MMLCTCCPVVLQVLMFPVIVTVRCEFRKRRRYVCVVDVAAAA